MVGIQEEMCGSEVAEEQSVVVQGEGRPRWSGGHVPHLLQGGGPWRRVVGGVEEGKL